MYGITSFLDLSIPHLKKTTDGIVSNWIVLKTVFIMSWHHAYADDEQIYAWDKDSVKLEIKLQC